MIPATSTNSSSKQVQYRPETRSIPRVPAFFLSDVVQFSPLKSRGNWG